MKQETLTQKFFKIGATDKHLNHCYGDFYGPYFRHTRHKVKNVIEIGVSAGGGELVAFAEFFPNAIIHAIDIRELRFYPNEKDWQKPKNIRFYCGDGYDSGFLAKHFERTAFDFVLDDGPHTKEHQACTLNHFFNHLTDDGCIMIEDVMPENIPWIYSHFLGDKRYLSLVDRTYCPNSDTNENILLYCPEPGDTVLLGHVLPPKGTPGTKLNVLPEANPNAEYSSSDGKR